MEDTCKCCLLVWVVCGLAYAAHAPLRMNGACIDGTRNLRDKKINPNSVNMFAHWRRGVATAIRGFIVAIRSVTFVQVDCAKRGVGNTQISYEEGRTFWQFCSFLREGYTTFFNKKTKTKNIPQLNI